MNHSKFDSNDEEIFEKIAEDILARQKRGERPQVSEYCEWYPEHADELQTFLPALIAVEGLKPKTGDESGTYGSGISVDGRQREAIGDYRILREVGRGGMGVVYEAEQQALGRRVALKVLNYQGSSDQKAISRFQSEAKAAARMHHTNIVPVFDVGQEDDCLYYAMQLIQGQSLDLVISDLRQLRNQSRSKADSNKESRPIAASMLTGQFNLDQLLANSNGVSSHQAPLNEAATETRAYTMSSSTSAVLPGESDIATAESNRPEYFLSVAKIGLQAASALAYSHERGIVHRDIKPSNLILDSGGVVWVTDFGLAKTGDHGMTHTGDILGTLRYMSPERFKGLCDARADVYSLGLTLYELLTLQEAFSANDQMSLVDRIAKTEPSAPSSVDATIPRDLETIVLKACSKEPRRRYQTAEEMAEDLQRFINDEPIQARRVTLWERYSRWSRRNRGLAASLLLTAALLVMGIVGSSLAAVYFQKQEAAQKKLADRNQQLADDARQAETAKEIALLESQKSEEMAIAEKEKARQASYWSYMQLAYSLFDNPHAAPGQIHDILERYKDAEDLIDYAYHRVHHRLNESVPKYSLPDQVMEDAVIRPDLTVVATTTEGSLLVWGESRAAPLRQVDVANRDGLLIKMSRLSRDGSHAAFTSTDNSVHVYDTTTGNKQTTIESEQDVIDLEFVGDQVILAQETFDGEDSFVRVNLIPYDIRTGAPSEVVAHEQRIRHRAGSLRAFNVRGDGTVVVRSFVNELGFLRPKEFRPVIFRSSIDAVEAVANSTRAIVGNSGGVLILCDESGSILSQTKVHASSVASLRSSSDGRYVASGGLDGVVALIDLQSADGPRIVWRMLGHSSAVRELRFAEDNKHLVSIDSNGEVRRWECGETGLVGIVDRKRVDSATLSPDGQLVASSSYSGPTDVWLVNPHLKLFSIPVTTRACRFSPNGKWLAVGQRAITTISDRTELRPGKEGDVRLFDSKTGIEHKVLKGGPRQRIGELDFSPNGQFIAAAYGSHARVGRSNGRRVVVWEIESGKIVYDIEAPWRPTCLDFSDCGRFLAITSRNESDILIHDVAAENPKEWRESRMIKQSFPSTASSAIRFSKDGSLLAAAIRIPNQARDHMIMLYNSKTWKLEKSFPAGLAPIYSIRFCNHGKNLLTTGMDAVVRTWDIDTGQLVFEQQAGAIASSALLTPDNRTLVVATDVGLRFWDTKQSLWSHPAAAAKRLNAILGDSTGQVKRNITNAIALHSETLIELRRLNPKSLLLQTKQLIAGSYDNSNQMQIAKAPSVTSVAIKELLDDPMVGHNYGDLLIHQFLDDRKTKLGNVASTVTTLIGGSNKELVLEMGSSAAAVYGFWLEAVPIPRKQDSFSAFKIREFRVEVLEKGVWKPVPLEVDQTPASSPGFLANPVELRDYKQNPNLKHPFWHCGPPQTGKFWKLVRLTSPETNGRKLRVVIRTGDSSGYRQIAVMPISQSNFSAESMAAFCRSSSNLPVAVRLGIAFSLSQQREKAIEVFELASQDGKANEWIRETYRILVGWHRGDNAAANKWLSSARTAKAVDHFDDIQALLVFARMSIGNEEFSGALAEVEKLRWACRSKLIEQIEQGTWTGSYPSGSMFGAARLFALEQWYPVALELESDALNEDPGDTRVRSFSWMHAAIAHAFASRSEEGSLADYRRTCREMWRRIKHYHDEKTDELFHQQCERVLKVWCLMPGEEPPREVKDTVLAAYQDAKLDKRLKTWFTLALSLSDLRAAQDMPDYSDEHKKLIESAIRLAKESVMTADATYQGIQDDARANALALHALTILYSKDESQLTIVRDQLDEATQLIGSHLKEDGPKKKLNGRTLFEPSLTGIKMDVVVAKILIDEAEQLFKQRSNRTTKPKQER